MNRRKWALYGVLYFTAVFALVPGMASAYIDPSVTTYAIQAIAGVAVAAGAFFATYGRRMKKSWMQTLDLEEKESRISEAPLEMTREDLQEKLQAHRAERAAQPKAAVKKKRNLRGRIITSLLCGFAPAMALILRPVITFFLSNEGEFWFEWSDVNLFILLLFFGMALGLAVFHFLLPDGRRFSLRLMLAVLAAAGTLCVFVQNHFMSGYMPVMTGEPIEWELYEDWNLYSIALWGGVFLLLFILTLAKPRWMRVTAYGLLAFLLCTEAVNGTVEIATATHENKRTGAYFTQKGKYETAEAGNVVVLIADTFEGTYMNEILERYPETRELLADCTYYDNVTSPSILTYFSYAKLMTGVDFPKNKASEEGVAWCFENQTTLDRIRGNGWDIAYYTDFSPSANVKDLVINYVDERLQPDRSTRWALTKLLVRGSLFNSLPHPLKSHYIIYTKMFEEAKYGLEDAAPYIVNDEEFYETLGESGLTAADGKPRYTIVELFGVHAPCTLDADFRYTIYDNTIPVEERKIQTGRAMLKLLRRYLDALKEAGTYDQTTVIMTADHGFNHRFYPFLVVKEARRSGEGFRVDHTPISMETDYEDLIAAMTAGKSFTEAAAPYAAEPDRIRYALDFRSRVFQEKIVRRTVVEIRGEAKDPASYHVTRDEFELDDAFSGRYEPGVPFVTNGQAGAAVAVYGIDEGTITGHSVVFDIFLAEAESRLLTLKMTVRNETEAPQRILFSVNGEAIEGETVLEPGGGPAEITVPLPAEASLRRTIELDMPDAVLLDVEGETLAWNSYASIAVDTALLTDVTK